MPPMMRILLILISSSGVAVIFSVWFIFRCADNHRRHGIRIDASLECIMYLSGRDRSTLAVKSSR